MTLMSSFESTASHVTAELRKVEVNLSQLPRATGPGGDRTERAGRPAGPEHQERGKRAAGLSTAGSERSNGEPVEKHALVKAGLSPQIDRKDLGALRG